MAGTPANPKQGLPLEGRGGRWFLGPWDLEGPYRGRASGLDSDQRVLLAALSEPASAGRVPAHAAGELVLPVCRWGLVAFLGELVVVLILTVVVVDDP